MSCVVITVALDRMREALPNVVEYTTEKTMRACLLAVRACADTIRPTGRSWVRATILLYALLSALASGICIAESPKQIDQRADPLVRSLETLYSQSMEVALTGDLDAYWQLRTTASRNRPPMLTRERLPLLARMLPPLESLSFVRLDGNGKMARALYRWPRTDMTRYTIIVYLVEQDTWRIDSIVVKTDPVSNPREAEMMEKLRRRAQELAPSQ